MQKTIYTLDIDGKFNTEIKALCFPLIRHYADKIGAHFHVITDRRYTVEGDGLPIVLEKFQVGKLAIAHKDDWTLFIDADALIHPDMPDVFELVSEDTVFHNGHDFSLNRFKSDQYFQRDGRNIGSCTWLVGAGRRCVADLWKFPENVFDSINSIFPIQKEKDGIKSPASLIDDYTLSRNIARFGLKFTTLDQIWHQRAMTHNAVWLWHAYNISNDEKLNGKVIALNDDGTERERTVGMRQVVQNWMVSSDGQSIDRL